jgi:hypothetical protein
MCYTRPLPSGNYKSPSLEGGLWKYNRGSELFTSVELLQWNTFVLLTYANKQQHKEIASLTTTDVGKSKYRSLKLFYALDCFKVSLILDFSAKPIEERPSLA